MEGWKTTALCVLAAVSTASAALQSPDISLLKEQNRIKEEAEQKIQEDILDPILGKGKAKAFVDVEMEIKIQSEESARSGMGLAERYKEKQGAKSAGLQTLDLMPGIPKPKTISGDKAPPIPPEAAQAQQAQQVKGMKEQRFAVIPVFKKLTVTVIHDDAALKTKTEQDLVRSRIVDAMAQYQLKPQDVFFRATPFYTAPVKIDWREDVKKPNVYLPLLYALLLLLFLAFLFGPLARFFRQYVRALMEKPGAEVNIEEKPGEEGGGQGGEDLLEEGKLDITLQRKPPEPPPEEDEQMKKFEPFAYINEENIKRLVYMFLLRKEEPWVIAVVASYLRPEYARAVLTSLPIELQAKVALEALTVRQLSREQVLAIDAEVKENVDFVVGGMERLTQLLEEADMTTRNNILNYLKNEKPTLYERVRKFVLTFDDVTRFPDREMQIIVRELKPEIMARALQNSAPEVVNKFLSNMSSGAAALLKEAIEYAANTTTAQIDEERAKILDEIRKLEREGTISVRERPEGGLGLEGMEEEMSVRERRQARLAGKGGAEALPAPAAQSSEGSQQAQSYFNAGAGLYQAGNLQEALPYFEYAVSLDPAHAEARQYLATALHQMGRTGEALPHFDELLRLRPDPQLRAWVDGIKAQATSR